MARSRVLLNKLLLKREPHGIRETTIRTAVGARKLDIVLWDRRKNMVLNVHVVSDSSAGDYLSHTHALKASYYNTEDVCAWVRERSGHPPTFSTLTVNW